MSDHHNDSPVANGRREFVRRAGWLSLGASIAASPLLQAATLPASAVAQTRSGKVRGHTDRGVRVFRGIPYGADTATRRFMPPLRETAWQGIREASEYGASAPQSGDEPRTSEECLFLNVFTPGLRDNGKRPILFYIHGGGYNNGSGSSPLYDGVNLCRRGDVVVVTVNHRLNAFGYLYLAELGGEDLQWSGNVGQLDLVQALRWVREHAQEFGGDAGNVTVFGQSGGGAKIATLMAMPEAAGLFHRAMTMSGQQVTAAGPRAATQRARLLLEALKIAPHEIDRLRTVPMEKILEAARTRDPSRVEDTSLYLGPVVDARSLHRHPFYPDAPPQSTRIPMIIGNTRDETRAFLGNDPDNFTLSWEQLPQKLQAQQYTDILPEVVIAEYRKMYPDYTPSQVFFAATTAGRSWRGAVEEAEARARQGSPAWVYQLDWGSPLDGGKFGAFHSLDIALVFDNTGQPGSRTGNGPQARQVAGQMSQALLAFARHGDPNHPGLLGWKPYGLEARETMVFDVPSRMENDPRGGERELYRRAPFIQRGTM